MGRRTKARECAFQILYQREITREEMPQVIQAFWLVRSGTPQMRAMAERLALGADGRVADLDRSIVAAASNWRLDRMAAVDRTILRLGAYELVAEPETPPAVVLDEAIELAKRFGEADSPAFVNGVLDAIREQLLGPSVRRKKDAAKGGNAG